MLNYHLLGLIQPFIKGWRYGQEEKLLAVIKPGRPT